MNNKERDARLSAAEFLIMQLLVDHNQKEMYGLELVRNSGGKLKKGTVYVLLGRLEDKGFISGRTVVEQSEIPRKMYQPTGLGNRVYSAWKPIAAMGGLRGAFA